MDWQDWPDDEFETFLREFRPRKPKALPRPRTTVIAPVLVAVIAVLAAAVVIPMRLGSRSPAAHNEAQAPPAAHSATTDSGNAPNAERSAAPASKLPGPAASNRPVSVTGVANGRRLKVGGAVKAPIKLVDVRPEYPDAARTAGIAGVVILEIVIGEDGSVIETRVLRSIPELDQAAIDAVSQWEFEPTVLNGEPVELEMSVTINFTLQ
jgi:periplasmic protein TonB